MENFKRIFSILALTVLFSYGYTAEEVKTIAVAGFINQGEKTDDSVNMVISRSLITFLSKVKEMRVSSYEAVEKLAGENGFWSAKDLNMDTAMDMGLSLAVKRIVTGTYKINKKKETIQIAVRVYDPATSELKLKRDYSGEAGAGIFDTVDKLVRNISVELVGHAIAIGKLQVEINSDMSYDLEINKAFQKKIDKTNSFSETEVAGEPLEISLKVPGSGREVYHEVLTLKDGETHSISYQPSGSVSVWTGTPGLKIYVDGQPMGETDSKGEFVIRNLKAGETHTIRAEENGKPVGTQTYKIEEGRNYSAEFGSRRFYFPVHLLEGGLGGTLGVDYYFTEYLRVSALGGAVLVNGNILPVADADLSFSFMKLADFRFWISAGGFCYFTSPVILSPLARVEISWNQVFIEGGARYGFDSGVVYPMIGAGYRFSF